VDSSGDLSAWSSNVSDLGDLSASPDAALIGTRWLRAIIDENAGMYVTDDAPAAERRVAVSFEVRSELDQDGGPRSTHHLHRIHRILDGRPPALPPVPQRPVSVGDGRPNRRLLPSRRAIWVRIPYGPQTIAVGWLAATAPGANDGRVVLSIDHVGETQLSEFDNDTLRIDRERLGPVDGVNSGTRGTYYFDAFRADR
jgi:hypothetical protein